LHHPPLHDHVQGAGRLIGDDELRPQADGDGDAHPLFHPSAQLMGIHVRHLGTQVNALEQRPDLILIHAYAVTAKTICNLFFNANNGI
jgi:hypothetical protein